MQNGTRFEIQYIFLMKYTSAPQLEEESSTVQCSTFQQNLRQSTKNAPRIKGWSVSSNLMMAMMFTLIVLGVSCQRFGSQRLLQGSASVFSDESFKIRVQCPYSFLAQSRALINAQANLTAEEKALLLADTYLTTLEVPRPGYVYDKTYLIQIRSIERFLKVNVKASVVDSNPSNTAKLCDTTNNQVDSGTVDSNGVKVCIRTVSEKKLYYCGLSRSYFKTCQESVKYTCSIPAATFDNIRYEYIDAAFINLLNSSILPNKYEPNNNQGNIKLCIDPTQQEEVCTMYEKKNNLQTFQDPLKMHNEPKMENMAMNTTSEKNDLFHVRINADNWPTSTHIHGLQIRPTMDGHPQSWVSNAGLRGSAAFSSQDQCYYDAFDTKDVYTTSVQPGDGGAPPPMKLTDAKGFDVTFLAKINRYPNAQNPGTLWYHDHAMRLTNYNAISGLAGLYLIRDPKVETEINVPRENQIYFLASQSVQWKTMANGKFRGGQVYRFRFLNDLPDSNYKFHFSHSDCSLVASRTKFTLIGTDGSLFDRGISDMNHFTLSSGERLQLLIKTDATFTTFQLCHQELQRYWLKRYVTLEQEMAANFEIYPTHEQPIPTTPAVTMAPARPANQAYTGRTSIDNVVLSVSYQDLRLMPDSQIKVKKMRALAFQYHGHHLFSIHGRSDFHRGFTEDAEVGTTEDYYFINLTHVPHPMHFHLVNFQVIKQYELRTYQNPTATNHLENCTYYQVDMIADAVNLLMRKETTIGRALKFHLKRSFRNNLQIINIDYICNNRQFLYEDVQVEKYLNLIYPQNEAPNPTTKVHGNDLLKLATATDVLNSVGSYNVTLGAFKYVTSGTAVTKVRPEHSRWKDTAVVKSTRAYVFRVRWTKNNYDAAASPKDTYFNIPLDQLRQYPGFVYHCHIIHHEDYEMMRAFTMSLPSSLSPSESLNQKTPCNYNASTRQYNVKWADKYKCMNKRCNEWAKTQQSNA